ICNTSMLAINSKGENREKCFHYFPFRSCNKAAFYSIEGTVVCILAQALIKIFRPLRFRKKEKSFSVDREVVWDLLFITPHQSSYLRMVCVDSRRDCFWCLVRW